jgi:polysaccharide deacetylase family protein (PEP-CTERM system associated)
MAPTARWKASEANVCGRLNAEPFASARLKGSAPAIAQRHQIANAITVDVEDYFHVSAFADRIAPDDWDSYPCRAERNVDNILKLFNEYGVRATFFTLGWVAQRYPQLVRNIVDAGHEVASHGLNHIRVGHQNSEEFRTDVRESKKLLEDLAGVPIRGYRAASFSIGAETLWAFNILADEGYAYSSSIYPIRHDLYGMPDAPRYAFRVDPDLDFLEIPISTLRVGGRNLPCGGGGYFRLMPYPLASWAMRRINRGDGQPCVFYFHPWELDPDQPRIPGVSLKTSTRHYLNLRKMEGRLRRLLSEFSWDRMDAVFLGQQVVA